MVPCLCSDEEPVVVDSSPEVVEVPPPHLRWWRCLHLHPKEGSRLPSSIPPGSKYIYIMEVKVIVIGNVQKLHVFYSVLVHSRRNGKRRNVTVSTFLKLFFIMVLVFCLLWCWCLCVVALMFPRAMAKLKGITDCQVTNSNHTKC